MEETFTRGRVYWGKEGCNWVSKQLTSSWLGERLFLSFCERLTMARTSLGGGGLRGHWSPVAAVRDSEPLKFWCTCSCHLNHTHGLLRSGDLWVKNMKRQVALHICHKCRYGRLEHWINSSQSGMGEHGSNPMSLGSRSPVTRMLWFQMKRPTKNSLKRQDHIFLSFEMEV